MVVQGRPQPAHLYVGLVLEVVAVVKQRMTEQVLLEVVVEEHAELMLAEAHHESWTLTVEAADGMAARLEVAEVALALGSSPAVEDQEGAVGVFQDALAARLKLQIQMKAYLSIHDSV